MRKREEIEEAVKSNCGYGCESITLEVMLDIRDLLVTISKRKK